MNNRAIYISIKPVHTKRIESGEKTYEFRKYYPKIPIDKLYVYESTPTCGLKYIIEIGEVVEYPNKISKPGYGNDDFNKGLKVSKYGYEIKKLYKLKEPILLKTLREKFAFAPPQSYAYDDKYAELTKFIENAEKILIIRDKIKILK